MVLWSKRRGLLAVLLVAGLVQAGCDLAVTGGGGGGGGLVVNDNAEPEPETEPLQLEAYATNTGGATGIALRPADGALFLVNAAGLFGPIEDGDDVATMEPIGATNLGDPDLFDIETGSLVLAITESGEFWIGSRCCVTLAVVGPEGGDAEPFTALLLGDQPSNIRPETMAIIPAGFDGPQMSPGNLLVGEETSFSRLTAIDVEGDRTAVNVDNPAIIEDPENGLNREAHHLTFGPDGILYAASGGGLVSEPAIQTIDPEGRPAPVAGTEALSADAFVVLEGGDMIISGVYDPEGEDRLRGLLIFLPDEQRFELGAELSTGEMSADDEMILADDGETIYLALPNRNEVVRVIDNR